MSSRSIFGTTSKRMSSSPSIPIAVSTYESGGDFFRQTLVQDLQEIPMIVERKRGQARARPTNESDSDFFRPAELLTTAATDVEALNSVESNNEFLIASCSSSSSSISFSFYSSHKKNIPCSTGICIKIQVIPIKFT